MDSIKKIVRNGEFIIREAEKLERELDPEKDINIDNVVKNYIQEGEVITGASIKKSVEWGEKAWDKTKNHLKEITL